MLESTGSTFQQRTGFTECLLFCCQTHFPERYAEALHWEIFKSNFKAHAFHLVYNSRQWWHDLTCAAGTSEVTTLRRNRNVYIIMAAQAYTLYFAEVLSFCSNAAVGCHRTELNQTLLHVQKLTKFENGPKNLGVSSTCNVWPQNYPFSGGFTTTYKRGFLRSKTRHIKTDKDF